MNRQRQTDGLARIALALAAGVLLLCSIPATAAHAADITVDARADIFGAGHSTLPIGGGDPGLLPVEVPLAITPGLQVQFPAVTGAVFEGPGPNSSDMWAGPDGYSRPTDIDPVGGIAGIHMPRAMPLVGIFTGSTEPADPAPARLDFYTLGLNFTTLTPQLDQPFFIGDGQTDSATLQTFVAPNGAAHLYLGIADANAFAGPSGWYDDNEGAFTVTATHLPEPTSALSCVATLLVALSRRRFTGERSLHR
jgi:hypothetical protein